MKKQIFNKNDIFLRTEEAIPKCGVDFCDSCGDCLSCYGNDECQTSESGEHFWVEYED